MHDEIRLEAEAGERAGDGRECDQLRQITDVTTRDAAIQNCLREVSTKDADYWDCRTNAARKHANAYFQYPAMMVPQVQNRLIRAIRTQETGINSVFDPFVGSGTTLCEAMLLGLAFRGQDINPMAILLCKAKIGPFLEQHLSDAATSLFSRIKSDNGTNIDIEFTYLRKWFKEDVAVALSKIRRAIQKETVLWCRQFFWIGMAEAIRLCSNARTETHKLYARPQEEITRRDINPVELFTSIVSTNRRNFTMQRETMSHAELLGDGGEYRKNIDICYGDSCTLKRGENGVLYDLLVTSPPYGDNVSTVTYGQHSYLPLCWIDLNDIDSSVDESVISSTHRIDTISLGGSQKDTLRKQTEIADKSPTLAAFFQSQSKNANGVKKVASFFYDFDASLDPLLSHLKENGYMAWTVGNRTVGNEKVKFNQILRELLKNRRCTYVTSVSRTIHNKRHPENSDSFQSIDNEEILILRKGE